ncbi:MAG: twin-arginine translocase TatA/TatE family subunit [Chloroflexota bacterium]|nr:twin-arginine translocase TatA/TatE family subunit [Chloroflexota bacterium]
MFGIGTGEILLILVIALIVLGPERMPQVARDLGRIMNDLRRTSEELQSELLNADRQAPSPPPAAPEPASAIEPPSAGATQAEVGTPTEPAETEFDREARLARERLEEHERAKQNG